MRKRLAFVAFNVSYRMWQPFSPADKSTIYVQDFVGRHTFSRCGVHHRCCVVDDTHKFRFFPISGSKQSRPARSFIADVAVKVPLADIVVMFRNLKIFEPSGDYGNRYLKCYLRPLPELISL